MADTEHARLLYVVNKEQKLLGVISTGHLARNLLMHMQGPELDNLCLINSITSETAVDFIDRPLMTTYIFQKQWNRS